MDGTGALLTYLVLLILSAGIWGARLGDWKDLPRTRGFSVFKNGRPFDVSVNLAICGRHTITINASPGVKDYAKIINGALRTLRARRPPGGTLRLGRGRFPIGRQIEIGSYTCIIGAGRRLTVIRVKGNTKPFRTAGVVRSMHSTRITLSDFTIDGNRKAQRMRTRADRYGRYGFFSELSNYLYLRRVGVINNLGYGFDPHGSKKYWAYYLLLENCYSRNNGLDGFTLDQTFYVGISNSKGIKNARHGINIVTGTRFLVAKGNSMKNNGFDSSVGCGIMVQNNQNYGTQRIKLMANVVVNSRKAAMCLNDVRNIDVVGNRFSNSFRKAVCIHMTKVRNVRFLRNTCALTPAGKFRLFSNNDFTGLRRPRTARRRTN